MSAICTWWGEKSCPYTRKYNYTFLIQTRRLTMMTWPDVEHHNEDKLRKDIHDQEHIDQSFSAIQR